MAKAIAMIEFMTVASGVSAADTMVKTSEVDILEANVVCPGKYIILISGDLSAVNAAVESAKTKHSDKLVDSYVLGNPHESIFPAIYCKTRSESYESIIESASVSAKNSISSSKLCNPVVFSKINKASYEVILLFPSKSPYV